MSGSHESTRHLRVRGHGLDPTDAHNQETLSFDANGGGGSEGFRNEGESLIIFQKLSPRNKFYPFYELHSYFMKYIHDEIIVMISAINF